MAVAPATVPIMVSKERRLIALLLGSAMTRPLFQLVIPGRAERGEGDPGIDNVPL
jgi:hypothetical protein